MTFKVANSSVNTLVNKFVADLTAKIEHDSISTMQEMVVTAFGAAPQLPLAKQSVDSTKRNYQRKPCPVDGCKNLAAPRHSMVCHDHKDFSQRQKDEYKARAMAPDGVWYHERTMKTKSKPAVVAI